MDIMTAISVDRLLALILGLRYKKVVTLKRIYALIITFLGCAHSCCSDVVLEFLNSLSVFFHIYITRSIYLSHILHKDFPPPSSSSKSKARPCSTTEPSKPAQYRAIQKGSVHCNMAATDAGRLLST